MADTRSPMGAPTAGIAATEWTTVCRSDGNSLGAEALSPADGGRAQIYRPQ